MRLLKELNKTDPTEIGRELHRFAAELYPICRSITGDGMRRTLALIQKRIPLADRGGTNRDHCLRLDRTERVEYSGEAYIKGL